MGESNAKDGTALTAQVFPRPMGVIGGMKTCVNPFSLCPSYEPLAALPLAERVAAMRDPALKARLLAEEPTNPDNTMYLLLRGLDNIYHNEREPDFETAPQKNLADTP